MNKIVHLSLTKKDVPIRIDVVQYATIPSIVFVLDDYTPGSNATANLYIQKPDGTEIYNSCAISGNQVTYKPTTQSFASLGTSKCQLQIIEPNGTAVSFLVYADVTENIIDSSAIESQDEFTALEDALREVESWESNAFLYKGRLTASTDLNGFMEQGRWHFGTGDNIVNAPDGVTWGLLEILRNGNAGGIVMQRITANNKIYLRQTTNTGSTWTAWAVFSSDLQCNQWTTYSATYQGLTIILKVNTLMPTLVRVKISGTTTGVLATSSGYVTLATFSDVSMPAGTLGYAVLSALGYGQIRLASGKVDIGYTRKFSDGTTEDIPTGRGIHLDQAFIVG